MKRFLVMLTFLTRIPAKINFDVEYDDYVKGVFFVPFIALIIGAPLYFIDMLDSFINPYALSFLILLTYVYLSGGLHIDGMADTMDALGSNRKRERMMEIMSDPRMGTFGVLTIVMYSIGMIILIPQVSRASILLFPLAGRAASILCAATHKYAKEQGLGKSFIDGSKGLYVLLSIILYSVLYYLIEGVASYQDALIAFLPLIAAGLFVWILVHNISNKLNGITGDVVGYSVEMSQISYLAFSYIAVIVFGG